MSMSRRNFDATGRRAKRRLESLWLNGRITPGSSESSSNTPTPATHPSDKTCLWRDWIASAMRRWGSCTNSGGRRPNPIPLCLQRAPRDVADDEGQAGCTGCRAGYGLRAATERDASRAICER